MDTDDLFEEASVIFSTAYDISEFLRVDIGTMAKKYKNEDEYLDAVYELVKAIATDQNDYLEEWSLEKRLDEVKLNDFVLQIEKIKNIPINKRTYYEY